MSIEHPRGINLIATNVTSLCVPATPATSDNCSACLISIVTGVGVSRLSLARWKSSIPFSNVHWKTRVSVCWSTSISWGNIKNAWLKIHQNTGIPLQWWARTSHSLFPVTRATLPTSLKVARLNQIFGQNLQIWSADRSNNKLKFAFPLYECYGYQRTKTKHNVQI